MDKRISRKPHIGEVVCYVLDSGPDFGQSRPAKITKVFEIHSKAENGRDLQAPVLVNLKVYTDEIDRGVEDYPKEDYLKFSRCLNLEKLPGTWHYSEEVNFQLSQNTQISRSRTRNTPLGVFDEDHPDRVTLSNGLVWYLP